MIPIIILAIEDDDDREFMMWLYTQYHALLYSEISRIVQNNWDTEDLLQTVLEKLIDKIPRLREMTPRGLVNYIITAAKHTALNFCRDQKPVLFLNEEQEVSSGEPTLEDDLIKKENLFCLSQVWDQLDPQTQYLLRAKYILNKSGKEIAQDLNMSPDSVRMAIVRAKRKAYHAMQQWQAGS